VTTMPKTPPAPELTPETVMEWLRANPKFLEQYPDAIDVLTPPAERKKGGGIADFQHYLVKRLKEDRDQVLNTSRDIMETARSNMNNTTRIHHAVLRLLECQSFTEFIETITSDMATQLDVDICTLVVEAEHGNIPHIHVHGIRMVPEGTIDSWLSGAPSLLQSDISGIESIYGGGATLVRSQALMRVDIARDTPPALLAFGSRDPHLFADGQGTELITFLTRVVERLFRMWLQLPLR
jgi:uncharacterized protein YigA (DUF484 family)